MFAIDKPITKILKYKNITIQGLLRPHMIEIPLRPSLSIGLSFNIYPFSLIIYQPNKSPSITKSFLHISLDDLKNLDLPFGLRFVIPYSIFYTIAQESENILTKKPSVIDLKNKILKNLYNITDSIIKGGSNTLLAYPPIEIKLIINPNRLKKGKIYLLYVNQTRGYYIPSVVLAHSSISAESGNHIILSSLGKNIISNAPVIEMLPYLKNSSGIVNNLNSIFSILLSTEKSFTVSPTLSFLFKNVHSINSLILYGKEDIKTAIEELASFEIKNDIYDKDIDKILTGEKPFDLLFTNNIHPILKLLPPDAYPIILLRDNPEVFDEHLVVVPNNKVENIENFSYMSENNYCLFFDINTDENVMYKTDSSLFYLAMLSRSENSYSSFTNILRELSSSGLANIYAGVSIEHLTKFIHNKIKELLLPNITIMFYNENDYLIVPIEFNRNQHITEILTILTFPYMWKLLSADNYTQAFMVISKKSFATWDTFNELRTDFKKAIYKKVKPYIIEDANHIIQRLSEY